MTPEETENLRAVARAMAEAADREPQDTPEDLEWQAAATDAMIEQAHKEQVGRMADCIEGAILAALGGFPWRRLLPVIDDACRLAASRFRQEAEATPPPV